MKLLFIYPHPDDESFGPASLMHKYARNGNEVYLLTLTKGGATKIRFELNLSIEEMGKVRAKEMEKVKDVLKLSGMTILDLPDSGLKELDPRIIEDEIEKEINKIEPNIIVTYPLHGISGFDDHLVTHAVVKRVYCKMKSKNNFLKRLAFISLNEEQASRSNHFSLFPSKTGEIDCIEEVEQIDIQKQIEALDCYKTYSSVINKSGVKNIIDKKICFEFFGENFTPPVNSLIAGI